jgi:acyl-CoA thioester hydrolase
MNTLISHRHEIRVRYADTDQMHIVWHGKYFEYFEIGRTELIRSLGLSYAEMEQRGTLLPLIEAHCCFHSPALYDDILNIESSVAEMPRSSLRVDYRIFRSGSEQLLTTGYTTHAFFDIASQRPVRPPADFLAALTGGGRELNVKRGS